MDTKFESKAELMVRSSSWIVGTLKLSSKGLEFQSKNNQLSFTFQHLSKLKIEKTYVEKRKLLRRVQEECIRLSSPEEDYTIHILSRVTVENVIQMMSDYVSLYPSDDALDLNTEKTENISSYDDGAESIDPPTQKVFSAEDQQSVRNKMEFVQAPGNIDVLPKNYTSEESALFSPELSDYVSLYPSDDALDLNNEKTENNSSYDSAEAIDTPTQKVFSAEDQQSVHNEMEFVQAPINIDVLPKNSASEESAVFSPEESIEENKGLESLVSEPAEKDNEKSAPLIQNNTDDAFLTEIPLEDTICENNNDVMYNAPTDESSSDALQKTEGNKKTAVEIKTIPLTYKRKYFQECERFSVACVERFQEKRNRESPEETSNYVFDIMNVGYIHSVEDFQFYPMPTYLTTNGKLIKCRLDGIYQTDLITAYSSFLPEPSVYQNVIISHSIEDSVSSGKVPVDSMQMLCLMPDVVDDFSHVFRTQLEVKGVRLFQIPRSIALAYAAQPIDSIDISSFPNEFLCLDYDGEELIAIKIRRELDASGKPIFVRMGRFLLNGNHPSYRSLAKDYIKQYTQKYSVSLTNRMSKTLIETKLIQRLLLTPENRPIILSDGDVMVDIWRDDEILADLHATVCADAQSICDQYGIASYVLCCFGWSYSQKFYGEDALAVGCQVIRKRSEMHKTLWEEYLPSLQLDVNQDGAFACLQLIGEKDRRQQIESAYIGKTVEIVVENGRIVLAANKDHYDLPLEREVYGNMNKEKLARFQPETPFESDTEVELKIYYSYGDVDSYKLVAISQDGKTIESHWCDAEVLRNDPPNYTPIPFSPRSNTDNNEVINGFKDFTSRVKKPIAPFTDMLYSYAREQERPYSKYLRSLNGSGFPYRKIRLYFDINNQTPTVKQQIKKMLADGTFDCIIDTLKGELPINHVLSKGTSASFPDIDQAKVLRDNLEQICRAFGFLYTYQEDSVEKLVEALRALKPADKVTAIETWAPITTYVTRDNDRYGVWESFSKALSKMQPEKPLRSIQSLRTISNVCFLTQNWIFEFYHGPNGRSSVDNLLKSILSVLYYEQWNKVKEYNPRKIRDVLELLLCICLLKKEDPTILDSNSSETKQLVKQLKKIDSDMRTLESRGILTNKFDCRIQGYTLPPEYKKVNPIIYCLIQTLTGGESINLVGFKDIDNN